MKTKKEIFEYIQNSTNWDITSQKLEIAIPLYMKAGYELWSAKIQDIDVVFAKVKDTTADIRVHQNAIKRLSEITSCNCVLVFDKLDTRSVESLIKKHISFIIKDKQIYMPFALLQIQTPKFKKTPVIHATLSSDADMILIGYLDNQIENKMMIKEVASVLSRELRATSQALKILETLGYLTIEIKGRSSFVHFISQMEVYERFKQQSKSPIKYMFFAKSFPMNGIYSGNSALSNYSMLIDQKIKTVALNHKLFKEKDLVSLQCDVDDAECKVEVWDRDPIVFSHDKTINPLYLLRFFQNDEDERVQEAIEGIDTKIIKEFKRIDG